MPVLLGCQSGIEDKSPNVLIIITDDQGWGDLRIHDNDSIFTPNLDNLATESVRFDRFYVCPVCAPTRASLLTGRYHIRTGTTWVTRRMEVMRSEEYTIAESFRDHGYSTACIGKWHNGSQYPTDPKGQGFDEFFGFRAGHWLNYFNTTLDHNGVKVKTNGYIADVLTDHAIEFISDHREKPFFCYLSINTPHAPFQVPDTYFNRYKTMGFDDKTACIYGMCENIDDNMGRLLSALDSLNLRENTIVVFLTDNGPNSWRYNGGMKGKKAHVDEGGVRVPFFIRYPGQLPQGTTVNQLGAHIDLFPTLHELCHIPLPGTLPMDGISLVRAMTENNVEERMVFTHQVAWTFKPVPGAVRTPEYRLVLNNRGDTLLYNMLDDPGQKTDISRQHPDISARLAQEYYSWLNDVTSSGTEAILVPVGYPEAPSVELPASDGTLTGQLKYKGIAGWAHDWVVDFGPVTDSCFWKIDNQTAGTYSISAELAVKEATVPCKLFLTTPDGNLVATIEQTIDATYLESPDRVPRGEVYEREWQMTNLGEIYLQDGEQFISFKAETQPGHQLEFKSLLLTK